MKLAFYMITLLVLAFPDMGACFRVESAENCKDESAYFREISGVLGSVIIGEVPFLTLIMENGDEFIMMAEDGNAVDFFRKNEGKKALIKYRVGSFLFADDFSDNGPGWCETAYYFKSAQIIK